jgi:hypothetical protein
VSQQRINLLISSVHANRKSDIMSCFIGFQDNYFHYQTHQHSASSKDNSYIVEESYLPEINAKCGELRWSGLNQLCQTGESAMSNH